MMILCDEDIDILEFDHQRSEGGVSLLMKDLLICGQKQN